MRTGAQSVQQALTLEAASVLKQSLSLARRRGHAQVTPLHVAATLLSFSPSSSCFPSPNVLRRACLKSHPHHHSSHPLQCRALELCFNVALNRLPTIPPPSSGPLTHPHPSLSNALIAALKRAQAHQRRGSIEQQQQQQQPAPQQQQQQQQQPLLAIKVELEQLIISILDDPSVSRVMREAGFSSTCVKANIEEYSSSLSSSSSSSSPCSSSSSSHREFINQALKPSQKEDLKVVFEVMLRKQGKRNNTVVVGDSLVSTEALITELICRIERGVDVPDELKCCHALRFHLSSLHLRLMSKTEIEIKVSELKKKISFLANGSSGVIVYVGDLKWVVDEEIEVLGFKPVEFMVAELQRLLMELRSFKVWLMATANYQTYIKCQSRQPSLENQWSLQAVVVPSGGLALSLQASSVKEEQEKLICCPECTLNYEKEASLFKLNNNSNMNETSMPSWLQIHRLDYNQKDTLVEMKRKWSRLCQSLHHSRHKQIHLYPPLFGSPNPWWLSNSVGYQIPDRSINSAKQWLSELSLCSLKKCASTDVRTTLALSNPLISDSATSKDSLIQGMDDDRKQELRGRLEENISGHSEIIPSIIDALLDCVPATSKKGACLLIEGSDHIAKQRIERVLTDWFGGFSDRMIVKMNMKVSAMSEHEFIDGVIGALSKHSKCVFFIDGIDQTQANLAKSLSQIGRKVNLANAIFVLITTASDGDSSMNVLKMKLCTKENNELKRKQELQLTNKSKRVKIGETELRLDLNISAEDEQDVPSDLTQETDNDNGDIDMPRITLNSDPAKDRQLSEKLMSKLRRAFEEIQEAAGHISVDSNTVKCMVKACGTFTEQVFDEWVKQVLQTSLLTVKKGGNVRLCLDSNKEGDVIGVVGFQGSCLPKTIYVD